MHDIGPKKKCYESKPQKLLIFFDSQCYCIYSISEKNWPSNPSEPCFFCCIRVIYFSSAYVLPTPLQCPPTPGSCVLICLRAPTLTAIFSILPTRPAFGASVGSAFCLVFSCFAYAGLGRYGHLVPIKVVPNWRDDRPKGLKGAKADSAYARPTRRLRQAYATKGVQMLPVCLFVRLPVCLLAFLSCQFHAFQLFHSFHFPPPTQPTQIESQPTSFKCLRKPPHTT